MSRIEESLYNSVTKYGISLNESMSLHESSNEKINNIISRIGQTGDIDAEYYDILKRVDIKLDWNSEEGYYVIGPNRTRLNRYEIAEMLKQHGGYFDFYSYLTGERFEDETKLIVDIDIPYGLSIMTAEENHGIDYPCRTPRDVVKNFEDYIFNYLYEEKNRNSGLYSRRINEEVLSDWEANLSEQDRFLYDGITNRLEDAIAAWMKFIRDVEGMTDSEVRDAAAEFLTTEAYNLDIV